MFNKLSSEARSLNKTTGLDAALSAAKSTTVAAMNLVSFILPLKSDLDMLLKSDLGTML